MWKTYNIVVNRVQKHATVLINGRVWFPDERKSPPYFRPLDVLLGYHAVKIARARKPQKVHLVTTERGKLTSLNSKRYQYLKSIHQRLSIYGLTTIYTATHRGTRRVIEE